MSDLFQELLDSTAALEAANKLVALQAQDIALTVEAKDRRCDRRMLVPYRQALQQQSIALERTQRAIEAYKASQA